MFTADDLKRALETGEELLINAWRFAVEGPMEKATASFFEMDREKWDHDFGLEPDLSGPDLARVLSRLVNKLRKARPTLKDTFRFFDENKVGLWF